jgi:hypothetical protein
MRKLKLELDVLAVQTFVTEEGTGSRRGTVNGHVETEPTAETEYRDCDHGGTGLPSGGYTCGHTCEDECGAAYTGGTCIYGC